MIQDVLSKIQTELKAPKDKHNAFGNYAYRNIEDLTNAVKPLLKEHNAALVLSDEIVNIADRVYVRATATLYVGGEQIGAVGWAREAQTKKGMDDSQITGSTSSYARKYAFSGLFAIDGEKDPDDDDNRDNGNKNKNVPPPVAEKPELTPTHDKWKKAIEVFAKTGNFDAIEKTMAISDKNKGIIADAALLLKEQSNG
jgi:hypothetical protein